MDLNNHYVDDLMSLMWRTNHNVKLFVIATYKLTDSNKYLAASGYGYYSQQQPYYQSAQPYNHLFYQPQTHQRYPYNGNQQYYNQYSNLPYVHDNHHQPHYPHAYNQNAFDYPNSLDYDTTVIRQAPIYPSPGAQPISPPVPHPFYHPQGTYYPNEIVTVKPAIPVDPKKHTYWKMTKL